MEIEKKHSPPKCVLRAAEIRRMEVHLKTVSVILICKKLT